MSENLLERIFLGPVSSFTFSGLNIQAGGLLAKFSRFEVGPEALTGTNIFVLSQTKALLLHAEALLVHAVFKLSLGEHIVTGLLLFQPLLAHSAGLKESIGKVSHL